ncbi:hypothetical protein E4U32_005001 [Claviceps aff. humidiphila group G2b]|nr:hypothetical protein E4U32_005001 [Claviceps aff. humidiphila group G2b]
MPFGTCCEPPRESPLSPSLVQDPRDSRSSAGVRRPLRPLRLQLDSSAHNRRENNGGDGDGEDDGDGDNGAEEDDAAVTKAWKNQLVQEAEEELVSQDALGPLPNTLDPPIWMPIVRLSRVSSDLHK